MTAVTLTLATDQGIFVFTDAEVPEKITFGGEQMLNVQKLVGGLRVIDTMGADDAPLSWSGWFLYENATSRARFLDYARRQGLVCKLTWGDFNYQVVLSKFTADFEKSYKVPYQITLEVVQDNTQNVTNLAPASPTDAIDQDSSAINAMAASVNIPSVTSVVSSATSALSAVTGAALPIANGLVTLSSAGGTGLASNLTSSISSALAATVNSNITSALNSAISSATSALDSLQSILTSQIAGAAATVAAVPSIGTLNPVQSVIQQAAAMTAQAGAAAQLSTLQQMSDVTTRIQVNLALVANPGGNQQVTTGGGNLYQQAAKAYGDATRWTDIAQASGLTDPMTTGFNTITIPAA